MIWKIKIALKQIFVKFFSKKTKLINDEVYSKIIFFITFGFVADYKNPKTFNEYLGALRLRDCEWDYWKYTDKYEARKYVAGIIGEDYLTKLFGVYEKAKEIDFVNLPRKFMLKANHSSGHNIIILDKEKIDIDDVICKFDKWQKINFYYPAREKNYFNIKPKIICEEYIETKNPFAEYKIFCFNGKPKFIQYINKINGKQIKNIYDINWNKIPVAYGNVKNDIVSEKPKSFEEAITVAEKLAKPFKFVRVDLYNADEKIIFSELTFHSGGGYVFFKPKKYDLVFGKYFEEQE